MRKAIALASGSYPPREGRLFQKGERQQNGRMQKRLGPEAWQEILSTGRASGKSNAEVAEEQGVAESTVHRWASMLERTKPPATFGKVERLAGQTGQTGRGVVVEVGQIRIRVERAEDVGLGVALARALQADGR